MMNPRQWDLYSLYRLLVLYAVLVLYSLTYEYFYAQQLTPLIHDDLISHDFSKQNVYTIIAFLTPLAILPIGTTFRLPGQFLAAALCVFLFIPIPIVFAPMVGEAEYWTVYLLLWLGYLAISALSSLSVKLPLPAVSERKFTAVLAMICVLVGVGLLYVLATNHFAIVSLSQAHEERGNATVAGLAGYLVAGYVSSYGGLMVAMALMYRKYWAIPLAFAGYVICYGTLEFRNAALMPAWVAYIYFAHKWYFRDSVAKLLLTIMAPFLLGTVTIALLGEVDKNSFIYDAFTLTNYRLFAVPAVAFNVYYNFFATHPFTYWSHINIIGSFVSSPYGQPLGAVMEDAYRRGSYNASFLETDGLAAAGVAVLPFTCMVFGLILLGINTCMRGLNVTILALLMAGSSIALIDTGLGPGLLSNGLAVLALFMLLVPRGIFWNLRSPI
ncbi:MAG: hypothetical protein ACLPV8_24025 [Steroidobacteraceae bacterium]